MQDAVGELGNRPVHLAAASGQTAVVKLLLRQGANVVCHQFALLAYNVRQLTSFMSCVTGALGFLQFVAHLLGDTLVRKKKPALLLLSNINKALVWSRCKEPVVEHKALS